MNIQFAKLKLINTIDNALQFRRRAKCANFDTLRELEAFDRFYL